MGDNEDDDGQRKKKEREDEEEEKRAKERERWERGTREKRVGTGKKVLAFPVFSVKISDQDKEPQKAHITR